MFDKGLVVKGVTRPFSSIPCFISQIFSAIQCKWAQRLEVGLYNFDGILLLKPTLVCIVCFRNCNTHTHTHLPSFLSCLMCLAEFTLMCKCVTALSYASEAQRTCLTTLDKPCVFKGISFFAFSPHFINVWSAWTQRLWMRMQTK